MKPDPILEEIWRVKDTLAREAGYDVDRVFDELQRLTADERNAGRRIIGSAEELRRLAATEAGRLRAEAMVFKESPPPPKD
jgi:hypothetical protein